MSITENINTYFGRLNNKLYDGLNFKNSDFQTAFIVKGKQRYLLT